MPKSAALALPSDDPGGWFARAVMLANLRCFDAAIEAFGIAARYPPALIDAHANMALLRFLQGDHDAALADLGIVLGRDPDNVRALAIASGFLWGLPWDCDEEGQRLMQKKGGTSRRRPVFHASPNGRA